MRRAKIVCTIGPATDSAEKLLELVGAGMNIARLNMSHGDHVLHAKRVEWIRDAAERLDVPSGFWPICKARRSDLASSKAAPLNSSPGNGSSSPPRT